MNTRRDETVNRRHVLQILAALGIGGRLAADVAAQARPAVGDATLRSAASLLAGPFDTARLDVASRAVQRNLDQMRVVRELDLDDLVEPAPVFVVKR
jgi:hypothetical protein